MDHNVSDKIFSIRDAISNNPQITIFTDPSDKKVASMAKSLLRGRITKLSINDSVSSRSAFIAQHVHFCPSEELKTSKVINSYFSSAYVPDGTFHGLVVFQVLCNLLRITVMHSF